jgi:hypothetical protein
VFSTINKIAKKDDFPSRMTVPGVGMLVTQVLKQFYQSAGMTVDVTYKIVHSISVLIFSTASARFDLERVPLNIISIKKNII